MDLHRESFLQAYREMSQGAQGCSRISARECRHIAAGKVDVPGRPEPGFVDI